MTKKYILIFILLIFSNLIFSQAKFINIQNTKWEFKQKGKIADNVQKSKERLEKFDSIKLFELTKFVSYQIFEIPLQKRQFELKHTFLRILLAVNGSNNCFAIVNSNLNNTFSDNSIFNFKTSNNKYVGLDSSLSFFCLIDSLPLKNIKNETFFVKTSFYIKPVIKRSLFNGATSFNLTLILDNYMSIKFELNHIIYEMAIYSHPVTQLFYNSNDLFWGKEKLRFLIYRTNFGIRDSIIDDGFLENMFENGNQKTIIVDGNILFLKDFNKDFTSFTLDFIKKESFLNASLNFKDLPFINVKTNKKEFHLLYPSKMKIIIFGGSWCSPCKKIIPDLKLLFKKYKFKIDFFEILLEKDIKEARSYCLSNKIPWEAYYEKLFDKKNNPIQSYFKISIYPTFILLNNKNEILLKATSDEGLSELKNKLSTLPT